jgi:hypothetical protein
MKKRILILGIIFAFANILISAQDSDAKKEKYCKIGVSAITFNNSSLKEYVGELIGLEVHGGVEVKKDLTVELNTSYYYTKPRKNEKFRYTELGVLFDYHPADFYVGIGPTLVFLENEYIVTQNYLSSWESDSYNAFGISGRIGYFIISNKNFGLYTEFKYSKINVENNGEKTDVGVAGVSLGIKF